MWSCWVIRRQVVDRLTEVRNRGSVVLSCLVVLLLGRVSAGSMLSEVVLVSNFGSL